METALAIAARKYPTRLAYRHQYDEALAHLIEGGSDLALIPSRVEPGAFSAMHSLKYGVLRSRAPSGVEQIIVDYDPSTDSVTAFSSTNTAANRSGTRSSAPRKSSPSAQHGNV
jgi:starch synthase